MAAPLSTWQKFVRIAVSSVLPGGHYQEVTKVSKWSYKEMNTKCSAFVEYFLEDKNSGIGFLPLCIRLEMYTCKK